MQVWISGAVVNTESHLCNTKADAATVDTAKECSKTNAQDRLSAKLSKTLQNNMSNTRSLKPSHPLYRNRGLIQEAGPYIGIGAFCRNRGLV